MSVTISLEQSGIDKFNKMLAELSRVSGAGLDKVLRAEVGKVLELCVKYTHGGKRSAYVRNKLAKSLKAQGNKVTESQNGKVWLTEDEGRYPPPSRGKKSGGPKTHYILKNGAPDRHWGRERWSRAMTLLSQYEAYTKTKTGISKRNRAKRVLGAGLAKQSWVHIGKSMGIDVKAPGWVLKAKPQDKIYRQSGSAEKLQGVEGIAYLIENHYPLLVGGAKNASSGLDGKAILTRAMRTRTTAFKIAMRNKVFDDLKARAERYPGIYST